jgi:hypothetical protein
MLDRVTPPDLAFAGLVRLAVRFGGGRGQVAPLPLDRRAVEFLEVVRAALHFRDHDNARRCKRHGGRGLE